MGKELGIYPKCHGTCQIPVNPDHESYRVSVNSVRRRLTTAQIKRALLRGTATVPVAKP